MTDQGHLWGLRVVGDDFLQPFHLPVNRLFAGLDEGDEAEGLSRAVALRPRRPRGELTDREPQEVKPDAPSHFP